MCLLNNQLLWLLCLHLVQTGAHNKWDHLRKDSCLFLSLLRLIPIVNCYSRHHNFAGGGCGCSRFIVSWFVILLHLSLYHCCVLIFVLNCVYNKPSHFVCVILFLLIFCHYIVRKVCPTPSSPCCSSEEPATASTPGSSSSSCSRWWWLHVWRNWVHHCSRYGVWHG